MWHFILIFEALCDHQKLVVNNSLKSHYVLAPRIIIRFVLKIVAQDVFQYIIVNFDDVLKQISGFPIEILISAL